MAASKTDKTPTVTRKDDMKIMQKFAENHQQELQSANATPTQAGESLYSNPFTPGNAYLIPENVKTERTKSIFVYAFIAAGIVVCIFWSAALFWLFMKALMLLGT